LEWWSEIGEGGFEFEMGGCGALVTLWWNWQRRWFCGREVAWGCELIEVMNWRCTVVVYWKA
jgi:hypothetical protein